MQAPSRLSNKEMLDHKSLDTNRPIQVLWGTPDKVADDLLRFREQVGDFSTLLFASHDWVGKKFSPRSMELMAEKVMPALNRATRMAVA
jgi:hypothetical protein